MVLAHPLLLPPSVKFVPECFPFVISPLSLASCVNCLLTLFSCRIRDVNMSSVQRFQVFILGVYNTWRDGVSSIYRHLDLGICKRSSSHVQTSS